MYIDKRVIPGFKYRIRPLPEVGKSSMINKCLFDDKALTLQSIGRGYARRFTFEADKNKLNDNEHYFWSDNRPEGYAFELELISEGDKFTFFDTNKEAQGTVEVISLEVRILSVYKFFFYYFICGDLRICSKTCFCQTHRSQIDWGSSNMFTTTHKQSGAS